MAIFAWISLPLATAVQPPASSIELSQLNAESQTAAIEFFESKIRPYLVEHCYTCHAADSKIIRGGLLLDSRAGLLRGGDSGPAVVPGNPEESLLLSALKHESFEMPPDRKLPNPVIADFQQWISSGALDPRDAGTAEPPREVDFETAQSHWAFQPISEPTPPEVIGESWIQSPIDRFVLARLEAAGMQPRPRADRQTLIRRAYFDLVGLPPTIAQVDAFLNDECPAAFANVVESLLESPHYGERWGRHWLDLVRYADSNGADENHQLPNAWHYRDWVVRMINRDQPLDQFIIEQLAGDLLPKTGDEQIDGDRLTATGMLVIGPKMLAEQDKDKMVIDIVDEQIDTVSRTMLGLTIGCARCHDHKFDPISTTDYYALAGIFYSTQTMADRAFVSNWLERPLPSAEIESRRSEHQKKVDAAKAELAATATTLKSQTEKLEKLQAKLDSASVEAPHDPHRLATVAALQTVVDLANAESPPEAELAALKAEVDALTQNVDEQKKTLEGLEKTMPSFTKVMAVDEATPTELPIHIRGNHLTLANQKVSRGMPEILTAVEPSPAIPADQSGRLQLAYWLVSPGNPLTARVMVNRIWMWHFGQALLRTPSNFGLRADQPTHPELLDYLAGRLIQDGWSLKHMHRMIMNSSTYQMSSDIEFPESRRYADQDPDNRLLWRRQRRRLEAEPIRDAVFFIGGGLDTTLGGKAPDTNAGRRALYLPINRASFYEMFSTFDYVETANHIEQRPTTTVPQQALFLLNSPIVHQQATAAANKIMADYQTPHERITALFRMLYARLPSPAELSRSMHFIETAQTELESLTDSSLRTLQTWAALCRSMVAANEFLYID
ncbi:MAG: PSD1 domain-containing protein [Pirellulaceae bacterium]|nr:PSD1 domain-containing protein [Pirellulaceae bacterium]